VKHLEARAREARRRAEEARAERELSQRRLEAVRKHAVHPLRKAGERNNFADMIRDGLLGGR
jgi:hypothetical protein